MEFKYLILSTVCFVCLDSVSICSCGWPGTCYVLQETHRNSPASLSQLLKLKACATMADLVLSVCIGTLF